MRRALAGLLLAGALALGGWLAILSSWAPTTGRACLLALCSHDCGIVAGAMLCLIVTGDREERKTGRAKRPGRAAEAFSDCGRANARRRVKRP